MMWLFARALFDPHLPRPDTSLMPKQEAMTELGARYVDLPELFSESDIIALHAPLTPETHHIVNDETLAMVKPGVTIVNTSRGGLIDTEATIRARMADRADELTEAQIIVSVSRRRQRRSRLALSFSEREEISRGVVAGQSIRTIAARLGCPPSTVSRELKRNGGSLRCYRASQAERGGTTLE